MVDDYKRGGPERKEPKEKGKDRDAGERPAKQKRTDDNPDAESPRKQRGFGPRNGDESSSEEDGPKDKGTDEVEYSFDSHNTQYGATRSYRNIPLAEKTNHIPEHYLANKKDALRRLKGKIGRPNFPLLLWESVLLNQYVDLGKIHAVRSGDVADEETVHETDHFKFVVNQIESREPIASEGAWIAAFDTYAHAVVYAYPHRKRELSNYRARTQDIFKYGGYSKVKSIVKIDQSF